MELEHCIDNGREMVRAAGLVEAAAQGRRVNGDLHLAEVRDALERHFHEPSHPYRITGTRSRLEGHRAATDVATELGTYSACSSRRRRRPAVRRRRVGRRLAMRGRGRCGTQRRFMIALPSEELGSRRGRGLRHRSPTLSTLTARHGLRPFRMNGRRSFHPPAVRVCNNLNASM